MSTDDDTNTWLSGSGHGTSTASGSATAQAMPAAARTFTVSARHGDMPKMWCTWTSLIRFTSVSADAVDRAAPTSPYLGMSTQHAARLSTATPKLLSIVMYGRPDMLITWPSGPAAVFRSWPMARIASAAAPSSYWGPNTASSGPGITASVAKSGIEVAVFQNVTRFSITSRVARSPR